MIFFFLLISSCCYCQNSKDLNLKQRLILTNDQNTKWFDSLKNLSTLQQVHFILERIILDTNIYIKYPQPDRIRLDYNSFEKFKFEGCCKPLIVVENVTYYGDSEFNPSRSTKDLKKFEKLLNNIIIDEIQVMPTAMAEALYGIEARSGTLLLKVSNKKSNKLIKKLYR